MKKIIALSTLSLGLTLFLPNILFGANPPLNRTEIDHQQNQLGIDWQLWGENNDKQALLSSINHSLLYLRTPKAKADYQDYPITGITRERVYSSLIRFRELLQNAKTPTELQAAVEKEFVFYQASGTDNQGTVHFTGYFEPVYQGSRVPTAEYAYPLYAKPPHYERLRSSSRAELEGKDGLLGKNSPLASYELVWLRDRLEAYLIHVQGSARIKLADGGTMSVGYAGNTDHGYVSIGAELIKDEIIPSEGFNLPMIKSYFKDNPTELDEYLPRNKRFIFFQETDGAPPRGNLNVPVTADRSIATDKSIMPPGALALMQAQIPLFSGWGELKTPLVNRYVLDQDTGSAIKGAGRVDIFMGTGKLAGHRAGLMNGTGQLYYLLLKD